MSLLLTEGCRAEAQRAFVEAIETARRQRAGLYHLRAARDLARLVAAGDRRQAIEVLAPAVERLAEHRAGLDYHESVELLRELRNERSDG
jgi:hypothetical protein